MRTPAQGSAHVRRKQRRPPLPALSALAGLFLPLALFALALSTFPAGAHAQRQSPTSEAAAAPSSSASRTSSVGASASAAPTSASNSAALALLDYVPNQASLQVDAASGIFFSFTIPKNTTVTTTTAADGTQTTAKAAPTRLSVSLSLCSGPAIPPYDLNNNTLVKSLSSSESAAEVRQRTLVRAYWTSSSEALTALAQSSGSGSPSGGTDIDPTLVADASRPGPSAQSSSGIKGTYLSGGASLIQMSIDRDVDNVFTIGVWPPEDTRDITSGAWPVRAIASMQVAPELVSTSAGVSLDDTDQTHALVTSGEYSTVSPTKGDPITPNVTLYVLPSSGQSALDLYFNSSLCALEQSFAAFNAASNRRQNAISAPLLYNITETKRGIVDTPVSSRISPATTADRVRMEILVNNLIASTNYTAWLRWTRPQYSDVADGVFGSVLYPAIKFVTKTNENCRLVTNLDFCPSVAYSIPIAPTVGTEIAVAAANLTFEPNMANFSRTVDTFPCGSSYYGQYSYVSTCDDCKNAYRDWLCAIVLPRCTDSVQDPRTESAASQTGADLTGASTGTNTRLLPYIVNRNVNGSTTSRRPYVDALLKPGAYGELLPCIYTCHFVARACPPIAGWSWSCPVWDVSAQRDYGTFVDAGPGGVGADLNGGDGSRSDDTGVGKNATAIGGHSNSTAPKDGNKGGGTAGGGGTSGGAGPDGSNSGSGSSTDSTGSSGGTTPGLGQIFTPRGNDLAKGAGQRWGGISRYVATDAFGHQYCNALGIDLILRDQNAARRRVSPAGRGWTTAAAVAVAAVAAGAGVTVIAFV
ncbi:stretch-activated cation channel mid1 [Tilletia horrida]|nr:stretch-activated cation channel mid1 [Tilletia horrida]